MNTGVFPDELKLAKVISLFKSGDKKLVISIIVGTKITWFEWIVLNFGEMTNHHETLLSCYL